MALQALDHRLDLCRGFLRALGQQPYFVGHHRKTTALLPGAGRFDGGVEGQQVGLVGNRADHFQHAANLRAFSRQRPDHLHGLADGAGELVDPLQAAIDIELALFGLHLGIAHFAGGMLGIFGHVLYAIGDFIDRRRHQFHLLRLLLAAVMGVAGVAAQLGGRLAQGVGAGLQLAHYLPQLGGKAVEVPRQLSDFILAMGVEGAGQVAFATGDIGHRIHCLLQRAHDAAGDQHHQQGHDQRDHQANHRGFPHLAAELALHVIDIHAGTDDPAPGFEQLYIGGLGHRRIGAGFGPAVIHHPGALGLGQDHELVEHRKAVRIADGRQVLAVELGVGRVHDHHGREIVDPEVVVLSVAQATYRAQGLLLRRFTGQDATGFEAVIISQDPAGGLHHALGLLTLGLVQVAMNLLEHKQAEG
eukprot:gene15735-biopygen7833